MSVHKLSRNKKTELDIFVWAGYAFFFLIVYLPVKHNEFKGWFIGALVSIITIRIIYNGGKIRLQKAIFAWILFYVVLGTAYILLGVFNATPGALPSSLVYVIWPLVYALFIEASANAVILTNLLRLMVLATIGIGLGTLYYLLWSLGWIPDAFYVDLGLVNQVTFLRGSIQMSHYSLSSLVFLIPFIIASLFVYSSEVPGFLPRKILWLALFLGLFTAFVGGRRALILVLLVTPSLILFFRPWLPPKLRPGRTKQLLLLSSLVVAAAAVGLYLSRVVDWSWEGLRHLFLSGFDFEYDLNARARREQFLALLRAWTKHPLIGAGLGANTWEVIRNDERPWQYELQYVLLLYQTGLIGVLLYSSGVAWIYAKARKMIRSGSEFGVHMVPVLVGTTCFLFANATNPYLQTFGHLWTIFLPVALINWWLLSEHRRRALPQEPSNLNDGFRRIRCPHPSISSS